MWQRALPTLALLLIAQDVVGDINADGCGQSSVSYGPSKRIVGGQEVVPHAHPWIAAIHNRGVFVGAGSLVKGKTGSKYYILSAAHLYHDAIVTDIKVILGAHNLSTSEDSRQDMDVAAFHFHPEYSRDTMEYDVVLVELTSLPDTATPQIGIGCVANATTSYGEICTVAGWGKTSNQVLSDVLHSADKPILEQAQCRAIYGSNFFFESSMICAGLPEGGPDSCDKDSGGPLMCSRHNRVEISGMVSWGYGCGQAGYPGVYAHVFSVQSWIDSIINV